VALLTHKVRATWHSNVSQWPGNQGVLHSSC